MDIGLFRSIIDQLSPRLFYLTLYFQGEPFIHPGFFEMVKYAKSKRIYLSTSTNGHFLSSENAKAAIGSGLDRLIISLDGTDQQSYEAYRTGGSFETVINGIREITRLKKALNCSKPIIILQFLVLKSNQHLIGEIKKLGKESGVDKVELKTAQFYDYKNGNPLMTDIDKYSRYRKKKNPKKRNEFEIKNRFPRHCFRMWSSCVVTWNGTVVPCCFDKDAGNNLGNLTENPFNIIWTSDQYRSFRMKILKNRENIEICKNCSEGTGLSYYL